METSEQQIPEEFRAAIGRRVREIRTEQGISQAQLARMMGTSRAHVCEIEAGRKNFRMNTFSKILDCLGVTLGEFAKGM